MGRYIEWADVTGRYIDTAKYTGGEGGVGSYWLALAESEIDAFVAPKYTVPFSPCPLPIKDLCIDLTYYKMSMRQESAKPLWEYIDYRLKAILNGTMTLTTSGSALAQGTAWSENSGYASSFGPDDPLNWRVSSDWMDAVEGSRD
jgi:phage gp36-like protein